MLASQRYDLRMEVPFVGFVRIGLYGDMFQALDHALGLEKYLRRRVRLVDRLNGETLYQTTAVPQEKRT